MYLSKCAASSFSHVTRSRTALSPVPCDGATERGDSGALLTVGMAVASVATDASEGSACDRRHFRVSLLGFFASVGETTRSGSSVSVGTAFGSSVCSTTCLLLDDCGRRRRSLGIRPDRQIGRIEPRRHQLDADLDGRRAEVVVGRRAAWQPSASATQPAWIATAPNAARIQTVRCQMSRHLVIGHLCGVIAHRAAHLRLDARRRGLRRIVGDTLERHQRDFMIAADAQAAPARPSIRRKARRDRRAEKCGDPCLRPPWHPANGRDRRA